MQEEEQQQQEQEQEQEQDIFTSSQNTQLSRFFLS
jgi:hypothetical protein